MKQFNRCWEELTNETSTVLLLAVLGRWFHCLAASVIPVEQLVPDAGASGIKLQPVRRNEKEKK